MTVLKSQFQEITLGITKEGVIKMSELDSEVIQQNEEPEAEVKGKATITAPENATFTFSKPANDSDGKSENSFLYKFLGTGTSKSKLKALPKDLSKHAKEFETFIKVCDELAEKNNVYNENYIKRGHAALYELLSEIYAVGIEIKNSLYKDYIIEELREVLKERDIKTQLNTPLMKIVIRYIVGSNRQTAAHYSRVLNVAMEENIPPEELAEYISRRGGISLIHDTESNAEAKKISSVDSERNVNGLKELIKRSHWLSDDQFVFDKPLTPLNNKVDTAKDRSTFGIFFTVRDITTGAHKIVEAVSAGNKCENSILRLLFRGYLKDHKSLRTDLRLLNEKIIEKKRAPGVILEIMQREVSNILKIEVEEKIESNKSEATEVENEETT